MIRFPFRIFTFAVLAGALACSQQPASSPHAEQPITQAPETAAQTQIASAQEAVTPISAIQGSGDASPMAGQTVTVDGIVVASYSDTGINGYYVQEEPADHDGKPETSEGVFVYDPDSSSIVTPGQKIRLTGVVEEYKGQTQISRPESLTLSTGEALEPTAIDLPVANTQAWERYENMLITFPQELSLTETYSLGRYGEVVLSQGGRLFNPTQVAMPGEEANLIADQNARRRIILDDAQTAQNPPEVLHLGDNETLRSGSTVKGLTGVLSYMFDEYRIQPVGDVVFDQSANPRAENPPAIEGEFRVASFNVLNYFNGNGNGGGFPTERGADNPDEFARQRTKIINAITALDADVIGLMEMENDGYGPDSAIQDLVNGLNEAATDGAHYSFVAPAFSLGTDAIKVAFIYNDETARPVGDPATTNASPFDNRRPPLAQTFEDTNDGGKVTIAVNHFKSKGCGSAAGPNADQGDGQGCWNAERTQAATTLADWLATDPTGSNDPDYLIIGDLNAYAKEDPLRALGDAGYTNLASHFENERTYSYVYKGEYGSLDHALANEALMPQVSGADIWHINSDEPVLLDYNTEYKTGDYYTPGPWKASDHDPVIIGLNLQ